MEGLVQHAPHVVRVLAAEHKRRGDQRTLEAILFADLPEEFTRRSVAGVV